MSSVRVTVGAALVLALGAGVPWARAQGSLIFTSVNGALERVDKVRGGIILKMDDGKRQAWLFSSRVLKEVEKFKPGTRMWVIYRQLGSSERAVTALGFPGTAAQPVYVNATGSRVLLRTAAAVDGNCAPGAEPAAEVALPAGASTEDPAACWCCSSPDKTCPAANRSGAGRIVLTGCFP